MIPLVRSVSEAISILRLLAEHPAPLRLTDVAHFTSTSPSTCLGLLRTLVAEGAIERSDDKRYGLSAGWRELSALADETGSRIVSRAGPLLRSFANKHDATTGLWRFCHRDRFELIALGESRATTRIHMSIGQRQPLGGGGIGRAFAAAQDIDEAELERRFAKARWQTPLKFSDYKRQVGAAKRDGFALDEGDAFAGICSVSCVVPTQPIIYLLSTSIFIYTRETAKLGKELIGLAQELSG